MLATIILTSPIQQLNRKQNDKNLLTHLVTIQGDKNSA